jgi:hypothetical protein
MRTVLAFVFFRRGGGRLYVRQDCFVRPPNVNQTAVRAPGADRNIRKCLKGVFIDTNAGGEHLLGRSAFQGQNAHDAHEHGR